MIIVCNIHHIFCRSDILSGRYGPVDIDLSVIPYRSNSMFLRKDFMLAFMNGWTMSIVGPHSFAAKWFAGRARPEGRWIQFVIEVVFDDELNIC